MNDQNGNPIGDDQGAPVPTVGNAGGPQDGAGAPPAGGDSSGAPIPPPPPPPPPPAADPVQPVAPAVPVQPPVAPPPAPVTPAAPEPPAAPVQPPVAPPPVTPAAPVQPPVTPPAPPVAPNPQAGAGFPPPAAPVAPAAPQMGGGFPPPPPAGQAGGAVADPFGAQPAAGAPVAQEPEDTTPANFQIGKDLPQALSVPVPEHSLDFDQDHFIRLLASSISLSKDEKKRIIESLPKLKQSQVDELIRIFEDEKAKFAELSAKHVPELERLAKQHLNDWMDLEAEYKAGAKKEEEAAEADEIRKNLGL